MLKNGYQNFMDKIFLNAIAGKNMGRPPVWMMRQAGRYHAHYQQMKAKYTFEEMCFNSSLAAEVALAPVLDFGFDCAILFSDILFILKALSQNVSFEDGPPRFDFYLTDDEGFKNYKYVDVKDVLSFQVEAIKKTIEILPENITMLGFVGGIATLFHFASGNFLQPNVNRDGLKTEAMLLKFSDIILDSLLQNMLMQSNAGAEVICIFDSSLNVNVPFFETYKTVLRNLILEFRKQSTTPVMYYVKHSEMSQILFLESIGISLIGIDETVNLMDVLSSTSVAIQGNFNNTFMTLPEKECKTKMLEYFEMIKSIPQNGRTRHINTLGHGVLKESLSCNIHEFVRLNSVI